MSYFKHFPTVNINGQTALDITRKTALSSIALDASLSYMSYTVREGERPEDVAYYYYDDPGLAWLVLASNSIVDPYTEWPKSQENLDKYVIAQYAKQSGLEGEKVLDWALNKTISANIIHYQSQYEEDVRLSRASFVSLGNSHTVSGDKIQTGEVYTIDKLGDITDENWTLLTGTQGAFVGNTFVAKVNGENIFFSDTAQVTGSSLTNPAREFVAVRAYDYEFAVNEQRREIQLINKGLVPKLMDQMEEVLQNG